MNTNPGNVSGRDRIDRLLLLLGNDAHDIALNISCNWLFVHLREVTSMFLMPSIASRTRLFLSFLVGGSMACDSLDGDLVLGKLRIRMVLEDVRGVEVGWTERC